MLMLVVTALFVGVSLFMYWFFKLISACDEDATDYSRATQAGR